MRYAIFCYQAEGDVCAMSKERDEAMMGQLAQAKTQVSRKSKFDPVAFDADDRGDHRSRRP
jgi:hypothetical protein